MLSLAELRPLGSGLIRPECVLAHRSGLLFAADWSGSGGVAIVTPEGRVVRHLAIDPPRHLRPNGIALEPGGSFLLAELGDTTGGVWRLRPDGGVEPVLVAVDGRPLPPANYVHRDDRGRLWVTVSTRHRPRHLAARPDIADGFVVLVAGGRARIVADGLGYTNECLVSPDGGWLYVNETFGRRLSRFPIRSDGLGPRETVATFGPGTFPDGLTFDAEGGIWITSIVSNRLIRVAPDGGQTLMLEDAEAEHVAAVEDAYRAGRLDRPLLDRAPTGPLKNISSLAFTGPDRRTLCLGCLLGDRLMLLDGPVAGAEPVHWSVDLGPLEALVAEEGQ
jgi:sugar lactone lactonase YvrE